jgi:hypothetical protein
VDDLGAWVEADVGTLAIQHLSEEDITASMKNGKTADELGANDVESDSEHNCDDYC